MLSVMKPLTKGQVSGPCKVADLMKVASEAAEFEFKRDLASNPLNLKPVKFAGFDRIRKWMNEKGYDTLSDSEEVIDVAHNCASAFRETYSALYCAHVGIGQ